MSRTSALILLGVLISITPYSGLPASFRTFLTVVFGIAVFGIGLSLRTREVRDAQPTETPVEPTDSPTESPVPPTISPIS